MKKVCVYIDGYNLYHAIDNLKNNRLKWVDLKALCQHFIDPSLHVISQIKYFSAYATWKEAHHRHRLYVKALESSGVVPVMGHFKEKDQSCHKCKSRWKRHEEKETDVNIALHLIDDAYRGEYDEAFVISQDSDLLPAIQMVRMRFPNKQIKIITPPNLSIVRRWPKLWEKRN